MLEIPGPPLNQEDSPYIDPDNRFQVGLLEDFSVRSIRDVTLVESSDGELAYTVAVQPRAIDRELSAGALAQISVEYFQRGEGFVPQAEQRLPDGSILIPWEGTLTKGRNTQPIYGRIFAKQAENSNVLMLLVSATEARRSELDGVVQVLSPTLGLPTENQTSAE
jgi:hypothetical protein